MRKYRVTRWTRLRRWLEDWAPAYRDDRGAWRLMLPWDYAAVVWGRLTERRYGWPKKPEKQWLVVPYKGSEAKGIW